MAESTDTDPAASAGSNGKQRRHRGNGEGSLYYVKSEDRWRGALSWTDEAGIPRRRTVSGKYADVRRRLAKIRADLERGLTPAATTTLADFLARWLLASRQRVRPSTWRGYEQYVRSHIVPALGKLTLAKLTPADVERLTAGMAARGLSPRTASHARVVLRRALADATRDGLVHRNAAALARPPRVEQTELRYLDRAELRRLLAASESDPLGPLVTLAASTGLRRGELLGLAWSDVDLDAGRLTVRHSMARDWPRVVNGRQRETWKLAEPKTPRSRRTLHLPAVASAALRRQRERQDGARAAMGDDWQDRDRLVFTDPLGRPLNVHSVTHGFHRLLDAAGLPSLPFHGLRHSAATALLAGGVPLRVVADQLGHSTITLTANTYASVVPELRRDAADAMDRALR